MAWFRVDDKFHSHSKVRKVLADDPAALALWVVAGSWSSDNLQDGFVPDHQLPWLIPAGADELAQKLIAARLWKRVRGGYQFHDFTDWNQSKEQVLAKREARIEAGRKGGLNSGKARSKPEANASANAGANPKQKRTPSRPVPALPSPSYEGEHAGAAELQPPTGDEPPPKCDQHIADPNPPSCGRCADARRINEAWHTERVRIEAAAKHAAAVERAALVRSEIDRCRRCDGNGLIGGRTCPHDQGIEQRIATGAAAARANIRKPSRFEPRRHSALDELDRAVAELHPPEASDA